MSKLAPRGANWQTKWLALTVLAVCGCARGAGDGSSARPTAGTLGSAAGRVAALRAEFDRGAVSSLFAAPAGLRLSLGATGVPRANYASAARQSVVVRFAKTAASGIEITDQRSGVAIGVTLVGASVAPAEIVDGLAIFRSARGADGDWIHRIQPDGLEDYVVVPRGGAGVEYDIDTSRIGGVRSMGGVIEFLDRSGVPRLRMVAPFFVDVTGVRHVLSVSISGCARSGPCRLALRPDPTANVRYPILVDPQWTTTSSMKWARQGHVAVLLPNGKLLVAGGLTNATLPLATAELYDPQTGIWTDTGSSMSAARAHASAVLLGNGKVLVAGGWDGAKLLKSAELYDPQTGQFALTDPMLAGRAHFTLSSLPSGKVLAAGGLDSDDIYSANGLDSAELFDPSASSSAWTPVASMPTKRGAHAAVSLPSGKVLVCGGFDAYIATTSSEIYTEATGSWMAVTPMSSARGAHTATLLTDGRVLVAGGEAGFAYADGELFTPPSSGSTLGLWSSVQMTGAHSQHSAARLPNGRVLVVGGTDLFAPVSYSDIFDPTTSSFVSVAIPLLNMSRADFTASLLPDGRVLATGGYSGDISPPELLSAEYWGYRLGQACQADDDCGSGHCADGVCCNTACAGSCVSCLAAKNSGSDGTCGPVPLGQDPDAECAMDPPCGTTGVCDGAGNCQFYSANTSCGASSCVGGIQTDQRCDGKGDCQPKPTQCAPYACGSTTSCGSSCSSDVECASSAFCQLATHTCGGDLVLGVACSENAQCTSGHCVDGVCCDSACDAACQACSVATKGSGSDGTCGSAKVGADPRGLCLDKGAPSCQTNGLCDGNGFCAVYDSTTSCGPSACSGALIVDFRCDGAGSCKPQNSTDCTPFACEAGTCATSCPSHPCAAGAYCDQGLCKLLSTAGTACGADGECGSGHCVNGVCCNSQCTGQCEACDVTGEKGTCVPVFGKPHDKQACVAGTSSDPCSASACDGTDRNQCSPVGSDVACRSAKCVDGVATFAAGCDGKGACPPEISVKCTPYVCGADSCKTDCQSAADCVTGTTCDTKSHRCVSNAQCDGHIITAANGVPTDCTPFNCDPGGTCLSSCTDTSECVAPYVCKGKTCIFPQAPASSADDNGCGCRVPAGPASPAAWSAIVGLLAAALASRRRTRMLRGTLLLAGIAASACGSADHARERQPEAVVPSAVADSVLTELERRVGPVTDPGARFVHLDDGRYVVDAKGARARIELPADATGSRRLIEPVSAMSVGIEIVGARASAIQFARGQAVYPHAIAGADLVVRSDATNSEDFVLFAHPPKAPEVDYGIDLHGVSGLRLVANVFELLDRGGAPRMRMAAPYVVDARGEVHEARVTVSGCSLDTDARPPWGRSLVRPGSTRCTLSVRWDAAIPYPAALDPSWVLVSSTMNACRVNHGAALLANGRVGLIGGFNPTAGCLGAPLGPLKSTDFFDPASDTIAAGPDLPDARYYAQSVTLPSGAVLLMGGRKNAIAEYSVYELDAAGSAWKSLPPMKYPHVYHTASLLSDGRVLVTGGGTDIVGKPQATTNAEIYDPSASCSTVGCASVDAPLSTPRVFHTATALAGGDQVLVVGGFIDSSGTATASTELFDLKSAPPQFQFAGAMSLPRAHHGATRLANGDVLVAGGHPALTGPQRSVERFDAVSHTWMPNPPQDMLVGRDDFGLTTLESGEVLAAGGQTDPATAGATSEWFDPVTNTWSAGPSMTAPRDSHTQTLLADGRVLAAGGGTFNTSGTAEILGIHSTGFSCTVREDCATGYCVDGVCCDTACAGTCVACSAAKKGGGQDGVCAPVAVSTDPDSECAVGLTACGFTGFCDGSGACQKAATGLPCGAQPSQCVDGVNRIVSACDGQGTCAATPDSCTPYGCIGQGVCALMCTQDADCAPGNFCNQSKCEPKLAGGSSCVGASDCTSGYCVDGVCCATACNAPCQACSAATKDSGSGDGTCGNAKAGTDPHESCTDQGGLSCGYDGTCDGAGGCHRYDQTPCGVTTCVGDTQSGQACDGAGSCKPQDVDCTPYACADGACKKNCASAADCATGYYCHAGQCVPQSKDGDGCQSAESCQSGFCVDGFCCDSPCSGQCQACDVAGSLGACIAVEGPPHGSRPACDATPSAEPCQAHHCDGTNSEKCTSFVAGDVTCRQASCADGFQVAAATCDGAGHCPAPQQVSCNGALCDGDKCQGSCNSNADCAVGASCNLSAGRCVYGVACNDKTDSAVLPDGSEVSCAPYRCAANGCSKACVSHLDCVSGYVCNSSRCVAAPEARTDSAGCGCHLAGAPRSRSSQYLWLAVLSGCAWAARRRRHSEKPSGREAVEPAEAPSELDSDNALTVLMQPAAADLCACSTRPGGASVAVVGEMVAGRYRVTRHIADGGMGVVCEAVHVTTGRHVALKIVRTVGLLGDDRDAWITRFRREARAVGALDSRHVTQVFDAGTDDVSGEPFIAMELLEGADLARVLKQVGPLPPTTALKIVGQACLALERAHAAGIIHRDIKPANVFLTATDRDEITVKLVDFGVAKIAPEAGESELTQTGSILGTPTYMSPEQARGKRGLDHRADLWALAVVLYKSLSGRVPHSNREGLGELILTICTKPAPPVQDHAPWVPPDVAHLLDRALQLDIGRRFQSAAELRMHIEAILADGLVLRRSAIRPLSFDERCEVAPRLASTTSRRQKKSEAGLRWRSSRPSRRACRRRTFCRRRSLVSRC